MAFMRRFALALLIGLAACGGNGGGGDDDTTDVSDAAVDGSDGSDVPNDSEADGSDAADTGEDPTADVADTSDASTDSDTGLPYEYPDPTFIHEVREQDDPPTADSAYAREVTSHYRLEDQLPGVSAHSLALVGGVMHAATQAGIVRWSAGDNGFVLVDGSSGLEIVDVAHGDGPDVYAVDADTLYRIDAGGGVETIDLTPAVATSIVLADGAQMALIGTEDGVLRYDFALDFPSLESVDDTAGWTVTDVSADGTGVFAATEDGVRLARPGQAPLTFGEGVAVSALSRCPDDRILAGTPDGVFFIDANTEAEAIVAEPGGLPTDEVTAVHCGAEWLGIGHEIGGTAWATDGEHVDHYISQRWVMDNAIRDVVVDADGTRWFATDLGISAIRLEPWTLSEMTDAYQEELDEWWWRMDGFVAANARTDDVFSRDGWLVDDRDNDGLWTQMMIGGWAMAAAVTGDDFYCEEARRAFDVMILQIDIPCLTFGDAGLECGFVTRSLVRDDEGEVFSSKATQDNWHLQTYEGRDYYWKDDTSSDEYAGHFYGYPLYYDHCATDDERELMADRMALVMDYIIDGEYRLLDLDGQPTTHGHWDPDNISSCVDGLGQCMVDIEICGSACFGGGFLNGAEILGALLATYHMTGEERFYDEYERLIREHRYDEVLVFSQDVLTLTSPSIENHSDHELMMLAYHTLIRYEPNDERRAQWIEALRGIYSTETDERNPLWAAFTAGLTGYEFDRQAALITLQELPLDRRQYNFDNSHRLDYVVRGELDRFGDRQFSEVPPYDEIQTWWWNGNPFEVVQGGGGRGLQGPMAYLLAYWATRYYGLLGEP